jgi:arylformamidase
LEDTVNEYNSTGLDVQYNLRAAVPTFATHFANWAGWSAAARRELHGRLDLSYGPHPADRIDIFAPEDADGRRPVQVFFHGGYWRSLSKEDFSFVAAPFVKAGAVAALVEYPLCPSVTMDELIDHCRRGLAWIAQHVGEHGGDPARLYLSGHSAGGHIVAMMLATDWRGGLGPSARIRGATAVSGLYELAPVSRTYLQADIRLTREQIERNSPVRLDRPSGIPLLLAVGEHETQAFKAQTADYAAVWRAAANPCEVLMLAGQQHFSVLDGIQAGKGPLIEGMLRQMEL